MLRYVMAPILLVLVGITIMLAPVMSTQWHNMEQHQIAREYSEHIALLDAAERTRQRESAEQWNHQKDIPTLEDPWSSQTADSDPDYHSYLQELDATPVMARIRVPAVNIDLPVYHGTEEQTLNHGVGHLYGTDLPVGGPGSHAVLTGHTGIATATLFDNLIDVQQDDQLVVEVLGEELIYRVTDIQTVLPYETESLRAVADRDLLTLITCTPYGVNTHRLLVTGERVPDAIPISAPVSSSLQPWMLLAIGLALSVLIAIILIMLLRRKEAQK